MKKLLIALAAVACAVAVNAATINWASTGNLTDASGTILTGATAPAGNFVLAYLGTSTDYDWANATVVDTATVNYTTTMGKLSAKASGAFDFAANTDYKNGDVFGVLYQEAGKLFYLQDASGNMAPTYTISGLADDSSSLGNFVFASSSFYTTTAASAAVAPEPTSGLLLLLGMAGLALKRKRA